MLKGKTCLITGASRGIGRGIAEKFAEHGAFIGINYYSNHEKARETLEKVIKNGSKGILLKGDVSNPNDVEKIISTFIKKAKNIDILVNNAGIYVRNNFQEITNESWDKVLKTNLTSCFYICKKSLPYMKSGSNIIFISSQLAFKGTPHGTDYATTKAGMLGLMRSLALELADKKIRVNAVAPGTINTDLIVNYSKKMRQQRINEIPLKRIGTPEDIANACLFLGSNLSSYITGETINVNGGLYIH
jgi:3-oxoacyl-[acyl-carrier protein] reductase